MTIHHSLIILSYSCQFGSASFFLLSLMHHFYYLFIDYTFISFFLQGAWGGIHEHTPQHMMLPYTELVCWPINISVFYSDWQQLPWDSVRVPGSGL